MWLPRRSGRPSRSRGPSPGRTASAARARDEGDARRWPLERSRLGVRLSLVFHGVGIGVWAGVGKFSGRTGSVATALAFVGLMLGLAVWGLWPEPSKVEPPRARQYVTYSACLLTDSSGLAGEPARTAWQGMQEASSETRIKVFYVATVGANSVDDVRPFLAGLVQRKCDVIIGAGTDQANAIAAGANANPGTVFVAVSDVPLGPAVHVVPTGAQLSDSLRDLLISTARAASPR